MNALRAPLLCAVCFLLTAPGVGQSAAAEPEPARKSFRELVTDDEDGRFDVSELVFASSFSFLPVPIIVTEPAVGYGGGLAPVWFHKRPDRSSGQLVPPSVSVFAAFATSDGSWGGGGHFHSWKHDTWRAFGFAGRASLELESAGISTATEADSSFEYLIDTDVLTGGAPPQRGRHAGERAGIRDVGDEVRSTRDGGPIRRGATSSEEGEHP